MPAAPPNVYEELKSVLQQLKSFLDANVNTIKPAIAAIRALPTVGAEFTNLLTQLIALLNQIKTEIQNLNLGQVGASIDQAMGFIGAVRSFLGSARQLLPNEANTINEIERITSVVTSLPSLGNIKQEIIDLITAINGHLNTLKTA